MKYFTIKELDCKETGQNQMSREFLDKLDELRENCGFPFTITSGYRSSIHSAEVDKPNGGGTHTQGIAADIRVTDGSQRMIIIREALKLGFTGIGVAKTFIHVDTRETTPVVWTYS